MEFWPEFLASSWGREFIAGGVGGMAGVMAGHPLDTLRIHVQQPPPHDNHHQQQQKSSSTSSSRDPTRRSGSSLGGGVMGHIRRIHAVGGPLAFFKGMGAPLASVPFQNAVTFQTYALLSSSRSDEEVGGGYGRIAVAGFGAGLIQTSILTPVELVKIRLQLLRDAGGSGPLALARTIVAEEGVRGLYRGLGITILRDAPAHSIYFTSYEYVRWRLHSEGGEAPVWAMLTAGGVAGVASWVSCYPLDVVKTRIQGGAIVGGRQIGMMECLRKSVAEEGVRVLWRGLGTAVARAYVVNAAIFSAYELSLRLLLSSAPDLSHSLPSAT